MADIRDRLIELGTEEMKFPDIDCLCRPEKLKNLEIYGYGNDCVVNQAASGFSHLQRLIVVDEIPDNMGYY